MYQLAQINVARMVGVNISDPIMAEFVGNLDKVNVLAEESEGFIWRLKDETKSAYNFNPYHDEQIIINISVWKNIECLEHFTFNTFHTDFIRRRKEWFKQYGTAHFAMWWIREGNYPRVEQSMARLKFLQTKVATSKAFDFKNRFAQPS